MKLSEGGGAYRYLKRKKTHFLPWGPRCSFVCFFFKGIHREILSYRVFVLFDFFFIFFYLISVGLTTLLR